MRDGKGLLAGRPIDRIRLRIVDDEIVVTGDHVNKGYLDGRGDADNKLRIDGEIWHRTGDAGRLDDDGLLWLRGRLSAKAGDFYPFEVEVAARSWPGVRRAALVPGSDPPMLAIEGDEPPRDRWQKTGRSARPRPMRQGGESPLGPASRLQSGLFQAAPADPCCQT